MFNWARLAVEVIPKGIDKTKRMLDGLTKSAKQTERAKGKLQKASEASSDAMNKFQNRIDRILGPLKKFKGLIGTVGVAALAGGILALGLGLGSLGLESIKVSDTFEQLELRLVSLRGSASAAEQDFEWIKTFAKETPLELQNVTKAFSSLVAFGLEPTDGTMQAIVDMASKVGPPMESLDTIVRSLGKSWSKGKLQSEEAIMMLERGVPIWKLLSQTLEMTEAEVQKLSEQGLIGRSAIKALILEMGAESTGAAQIQMETLTGKVSNLKDIWVEALNEIGSGGASDAAKETISELIGLLGDLKEKGTLNDIATGLAEVATSVTSFASAVRENIDDIENFFEKLSQLKKLNDEWGSGFMVNYSKEALGILADAGEGYEFFAEVLGLVNAGLTDEEKNLLASAVAMKKLEAQIKKQEQARTQGAKRELAREKAREAARIAILEFEQEKQDKLDEAEAKKTEAFELAVKQADEMDDIALRNFQRNKQILADLGIEATARETLNAKLSEQHNNTTNLLRPTIELATVSSNANAITIETLRLRALERHAADDLIAKIEGLAGALDDIQNRAVSDALLGGLFGEDDSFFTAFTAAGERSATAFIDAFISEWGAGSGLDKVFEDLQFMVDNGQISTETMETVGNVLSIASAAMAVYQSWDQPMSPIERGMMGAQVGSAAGPWGALIGGIMGFIHGLADMGAAPGIRASWQGERQGLRGGRAGEWDRLSDITGLGGGAFSGFSLGLEELNLKDFDWDKLIASMNQAVTTTHAGFLSIFELFGDIDLMLGAGLFNFSLDTIKGEDWAILIERWITDEIPTAVFDQMEDGLRSGLAMVGYTDDKIEEIFAEAAGMTGQQLIDFLGRIASGAVAIGQAVEDANIDEIYRVMDLSSLQAFGEGMGDLFEQIDLIQARLAMSISVADQAMAAEQIAGLIQSARLAEIQMLMQIQAMQDGINASISSAIETLTLGGMSETEQQDYLINQIVELIGQFGKGMSPEDIQSTTADALGYLGNLINNFDALDIPGIYREGLDSIIGDYQDYGGEYMSGLGDLAESLGLELDPEESFREFFIRAYEAIRGLSDVAFEGARDEVEGWADRLLDEANATADALFALGEAARGILFGPPDEPEPPPPSGGDLPPFVGGNGDPNEDEASSNKSGYLGPTSSPINQIIVEMPEVNVNVIFEGHVGVIMEMMRATARKEISKAMKPRPPIN